MKNRNIEHKDDWATPKDLYDKLDNEPLVKIYINVYDWCVANKIYTSKQQADEDVAGRNRFLCIQNFISVSQLKLYKKRQKMLKNY